VLVCILSTLLRIVLVLLVLLYLYSRPALLRLPGQPETSLDGIVTLDDAVSHLRNSRQAGWDLVEAAQKLVSAKMRYSRRNNWETPARAFRRGMGYCQQQAFALRQILIRLGFQARPVRTTKGLFPPAPIHEYISPERISAHTWLVVTLEGEERDVCPGHRGNAPGRVHLTLLAPRTEYPPYMWLFGHIGSMILNVRRDSEALRVLRQGSDEKGMWRTR